MKRIIYTVFLFVSVVFFNSCGFSSDSNTQAQDNTTTGTGEKPLDDIVFLPSKTKVPTLVVILNWNDFSETDPKIWHDKIFNYSVNSVNRWYYDSTDGNIEFVPVTESEGSINDGVITVNMNKAHPGGFNDTTFRDTEIANAITSATVVDNVDFAALDIDNDGDISHTELQIIFIVAGGEESYGDSRGKSIWAHAWAFDSASAPVVDGVNVMRASLNSATAGSYARFGATHGIDTQDAHKATIGIIAHELGHALLNLDDLYDIDNGGSGLGYYDIMSSGTWAKKEIDVFPGETPVQFSAFSKFDANLDVNITTVSASTVSSISCSSGEFIKLTTASPNEYFIVACRDSSRIDSDKSFNYLDSEFTDNRLFALVYHVDTNKTTNDESGNQTQTHHYKVRLVEKDPQNTLTSNENVKANFSDSYIDGDFIQSAKLTTYDASASYTITVEQSDYTKRTMRFRIEK